MASAAASAASAAASAAASVTSVAASAMIGSRFAQQEDGEDAGASSPSGLPRKDKEPIGVRVTRRSDRSTIIWSDDGTPEAIQRFVELYNRWMKNQFVTFGPPTHHGTSVSPQILRWMRGPLNNGPRNLPRLS